MASGSGFSARMGSRGRYSRPFQRRRQLPHVPEGWFDYSAYGTPIDGTRIIPIKTPLKQAFNSGERKPSGTGVVADYKSGVPLEEELTPTQVVKKLKGNGWTLGMVIDLTFTKRYYDAQEFHSLGVKYAKILCPGREIPNDEVYEQFAAALTEFLQDPANGSSFIAVHCTHGLNRTGYLLCRYMKENCGFSAEDAIQAFNKARGYNIERENYLEHLRKGCPPLHNQGSPPHSKRSPKAIDSRHTNRSKEHVSIPVPSKHDRQRVSSPRQLQAGNSHSNSRKRTEKPAACRTYMPTAAATEDSEQYFATDHRQRHERLSPVRPPESDHHYEGLYRGRKRPRSDHGEESPYHDSAYYCNSANWDYPERRYQDGGAHHAVRRPVYEPWGVHTSNMRPHSTKRRAYVHDFDAWRQSGEQEAKVPLTVLDENTKRETAVFWLVTVSVVLVVGLIFFKYTK